MIVSKLKGGLGNQLFEWAAGYELANFHNVEYKLDARVYGRNKYRLFELDNLMIPYELASETEIKTARKNNFYKQPHFHFDKNFYDQSSLSLLRGYFCSEKYFYNCRFEIQSMLSGAIDKIRLNEKQKSLLASISDSNSVSIHIRRGDYVSNNKYSDFFGTCSMGYYQLAIKKIESKLSNSAITIFVFSDDLEWARNNLALNNTVVNFVDVNGDNGYLDMLFMSRCRHNIIANSTFSWWSAFINTNHDKLVIAPKAWFTRNYREKGEGAWIESPYYDTKDLFPPTWIQL